MQVEPSDDKPGETTNASSTSNEPTREVEMKDVEPQPQPPSGSETTTASTTSDVKSPEQTTQNTQLAADKPALQDGKLQSIGLSIQYVTYSSLAIVFKNIIADVMKNVPAGTKPSDPNLVTIPVGNPILDLDAQFAAMLQAQFENGKAHV